MFQDSLGFWNPHGGFWIPDTGFQYSSVVLGFWIPIFSGIPDSLRRIADSKTQDSGFHKLKFPRFQNADSVIWCERSSVSLCCDLFIECCYFSYLSVGKPVPPIRRSGLRTNTRRMSRHVWCCFLLTLLRISKSSYIMKFSGRKQRKFSDWNSRGYLLFVHFRVSESYKGLEE